MRFEDKRVVVTGAGSGIGKAVTKLFLEEGAEVIAVQNRSPAEYATTRVTMSLGDADSIAQACEQIPENIDILCNVAGLGADDGTAEDVIAVNFVGTRLFTERLIGRISPGGCLLNFGSTAGRNWRNDIELIKRILVMKDFSDVAPFWQSLDLPKQRSYNLAKGAVAVWSMKLAAQHTKTGPRVNVLNPGFTDTPMLQKALATGNEVVIKLAQSNPFTSQPEDVARVALFLCSAEAKAINGAELLVDSALVATGVCAEYEL